ncbi:MAG: hypothetical protein H7X77_04480 [Anaerolineae bacterium]|nr:hypothetical protein [Anaerolineae bacterium]
MLRLIAGLSLVLLLLILTTLTCIIVIAPKLANSDQVAVFHSDYVDHLGIFVNHRLSMLDVDRQLHAAVPLPGYVLAAHWSADGKTLLMQLVPDRYVVWQTAPFWEWNGHTLTNRTDLLNTIFDFDMLPDGDLVIVEQIPMNGAAVMRVAPDGTREIITALRGAFTIDASPDGNWAMVNGVDEQGKMFTRIVNLATGEHRLINASILALSIFQYAWSGDGDTLLYVRNSPTLRGIQQQQVSTGAEQMLWTGAVNGPLVPSWTGEWLALTGLEGYASPITLLKLVDADAALRELPGGAQFVHNLTWSPGGKLSYFAMLPQTWLFIVHDTVTALPRARLVVDEKIAPPVWRPQ